VYTGLLDGRIIKVDLKEETYSLVTRMGDPPYDKCGKSIAFGCINQRSL